jgi:hypothetical protein
VPPTGNPAFITSPTLYPHLVSQLLPGDILTMTVARTSPEVPILPNDPGFSGAVEKLNEVDERQLGVTKRMILSSYADLQRLISYIPADVEIISYNAEHALTPANESHPDNLPSVALQFAATVRSTGRKMHFAPVRDFLNSMEKRGELEQVLQGVDGVGYQGQNLLEQGGENQFVNTVKSDSVKFRGINPALTFEVQLWFTLQTPQEAARAFNRVQNDVDAVGAGPSSIDYLDHTRQLENGLSWR